MLNCPLFFFFLKIKIKLDLFFVKQVPIILFCLLNYNILLQILGPWTGLLPFSQVNSV